MAALIHVTFRSAFQQPPISWTRFPRNSSTKSSTTFHTPASLPPLSSRGDGNKGANNVLSITSRSPPRAKSTVGTETSGQKSPLMSAPPLSTVSAPGKSPRFVTVSSVTSVHWQHCGCMERRSPTDCQVASHAESLVRGSPLSPFCPHVARSRLLCL